MDTITEEQKQAVRDKVLGAASRYLAEFGWIVLNVREADIAARLMLDYPGVLHAEHRDGRIIIRKG